MNVKLKTLTFASNYRSSQEPAILEKSSRIVGNSGTEVQYRIVCGLAPDLTIAPRYVVHNGVAMKLSGNEAQQKSYFVQSKGLQRDASVYYRLSECSMVAYLTINASVNNVRNITHSHLAVYVSPRVNVGTKEAECKSITLNPGIERQIIQMMLLSIWNRGIF